MEESKENTVQQQQVNNEQIEYECFICYDLPQRPVKSKCCKQISCYSHVPSYRNKCPFCRTEPFQHEECKEINDKVLEKWVERTIENKEELKCKKKECDFKGEYSQFQQHSQEKHQEKFEQKELKKYIENDQLREIVSQKMKAGVLKRKQKMLRQLWVTAMRDQLQPSYGTKKIATQEQRDAMKQHVENCQNDGCNHLWSGRWGPFIGGEQGRTHFDLTECEVGKQLNLAINWNYDNPAY